jgi:hypothetical protein
VKMPTPTLGASVVPDRTAYGKQPREPKPVWRCTLCGRFYSERTAKNHAPCQQEEDRRDAERSGAFGV